MRLASLNTMNTIRPQAQTAFAAKQADIQSQYKKELESFYTRLSRAEDDTQFKSVLRSMIEKCMKGVPSRTADTLEPCDPLEALNVTMFYLLHKNGKEDFERQCMNALSSLIFEAPFKDFESSSRQLPSKKLAVNIPVVRDSIADYIGIRTLQYMNTPLEIRNYLELKYPRDVWYGVSLQLERLFYQEFSGSFTPQTDIMIRQAVPVESLFSLAQDLLTLMPEDKRELALKGLSWAERKIYFSETLPKKLWTHYVASPYHRFLQTGFRMPVSGQA